MNKFKKVISIISITVIASLTLLANAEPNSALLETTSFSDNGPIIAPLCMPYPACMFPK